MLCKDEDHINIEVKTRATTRDKRQVVPSAANYIRNHPSCRIDREEGQLGITSR